MEAPAESGASFDAALDDFQATLNGEETEQTPTPVEHAADEMPPAAETEAQTGDQPPAEGESEYQLAEDGQHYLVPKDQLGVFQTNKEYLAKVQEAFPTIADAEAARGLASNWNQMRQDFLYNGDQGLEKMLAYLSGKNVDPSYPEVRQQFEQGFIRMASKVPEMLESMAPEAHREVLGKLIGPYIEGAYQHAAETGDPAALKAAQNVDWYFTGQYKAEAPKFDPNAARLQEQQAREQELSAREAEIRTHEWNTVNQANIEGAKARDFNAELDRALSTFKDRYDSDRFAFIRKEIAAGLVQKLGEDRIWATDHSNQFVMLKKSFETGWKPGKQVNLQAANAWKNDFMGRVRRYLPSIVEKVLKGAPPKAAAPRTTKTPPTPARPNAPARAQNGQYTREQRDAEFEAGVNDLAKSFGW
jgi:hypothetical protein